MSLLDPIASEFVNKRCGLRSRSGSQLASRLLVTGVLCIALGCTSSEPQVDAGATTADGGPVEGTVGGSCRSNAPECDADLACVSNVCVANADSGVEDAGIGGDGGDTGDGGPTDSGPPPLCAMTSSTSSVAGACVDARDCAAPVAAPINCEACADYTRALCAEGTCASTPQIETQDIHTLTFSVPSSLQPNIESFGGFVVQTRAASGLVLDCATVESGSIDLTDPCVHVLDSRGVDVGRVAATFTMSFARFLSNQPVLFVVYSFGQNLARGPALGVSCTAFSVGPPGTGLVQVSGSPMHSL